MGEITRRELIGTSALLGTRRIGFVTEIRLAEEGVEREEPVERQGGRKKSYKIIHFTKEAARCIDAPSR